MVYAVQNYKVYFGLYPSSDIYDKKKFFCHIYQTMDKVQNKPYRSVQHTPSSESLKVYMFLCHGYGYSLSEILFLLEECVFFVLLVFKINLN
jgi:hypothetical protein